MPYYGPNVLPEVPDAVANWGDRIAKAFQYKAELERQQRLDDQAAIEHGFIPKGAKSMPAPTSNSSTSTPSGAELAGAFSTDGDASGGWDEQYHPEDVNRGVWDEIPPGGTRARDGFRMPTMPARPGSVASAPTTAPDPAALAGAFDQTPTSRDEASTATAAGQPSTPTLPAPVHPGAFDPATRTFGGNPLQVATAAQHAGVAPQGAPAGPQGVTPMPNAAPGAAATPMAGPLAAPASPRFELASGDVYDPSAVNPNAQLEQRMKLAELFGNMGLHEDQASLARARAAALNNPRANEDPVSLTVDGRPVSGFRNKVSGAITDMSGQPIDTRAHAVQWAAMPSATADQRETKGVMVNGKPLMISVNKDGSDPRTLFGQPIASSTITPFEAPPQPVIVQGQTADGKPAGFFRINKEGGDATPVGGIESKQPSGMTTAQARKERTYVDLMGQALPTMEALSGKVRPWAIAAAIKAPTAGNTILNQDEQSYLVAARDYLAGMLHQESGARLSHEQLVFGLQRVFPNLGDTRQTVAEKLAGAQKTYKDRHAALGPGTASAGSGGSGGTPLSDEDKARAQSDPAFAAWLKSKGYEIP